MVLIENVYFGCHFDIFFSFAGDNAIIRNLLAVRLHELRNGYTLHIRDEGNQGQNVARNIPYVPEATESSKLTYQSGYVLENLLKCF